MSIYIGRKFAKFLYLYPLADILCICITLCVIPWCLRNLDLGGRILLLWDYGLICGQNLSGSEYEPIGDVFHYGNEIWDSVKHGEFFEYLSDCYILIKTF